jgi:hypothetical protein
VFALAAELVCGEMPDPFRRESEQQGQRACGADVDGNRRVCQASLQESPALVVIEQRGWLLTRNGGHDQFS